MRADGCGWPKKLDADAARIVALYRAGGTPVKQIAYEWKVTEHSVRAFLRHYGVFEYLRKPSSKFIREAFHRRKMPLTDRICLNCRRVFGSFGVGNRICQKCKETDIFESGGCAEDFPGGHL